MQASMAMNHSCEESISRRAVQCWERKAQGAGHVQYNVLLLDQSAPETCQESPTGPVKWQRPTPSSVVKWQRYGNKVDTIKFTQGIPIPSQRVLPSWKKGVQKGVQKDQCSLLLFGSGLHGPRYLDKCKNAQLPTWKVDCRVL